MLISYCTPVMRRLEHLQKTLPDNISNADDLTQFAILNFCDPKVDEWIKKEGYDRHPKVRYGIMSGYKYYLHSLSKNQAALLSTGDYIVGLDADAYIKKTIKPLREVITENGFVDCLGITGFLGMTRKLFFDMGGYSEDFVHGWGWTDIDLRNRLKAKGHIGVRINGGQSIIHSNELRYQNTVQNNLDELFDGPRLHAQISQKNIRLRLYTANIGTNWQTPQFICKS